MSRQLVVIFSPLLAIGMALIYFVLSAEQAEAVKDAPWDYMPAQRAHVPHASFLTGPFERPQDVTKRCLDCHPEASREVMKTSHWTWIAEEVEGLDGKPLGIGKRNLINNFCLGAQPNLEMCTSCHAGYGYDSNDFDFSDELAVDCLVCHDSTETYRKKGGGWPKDDVDLVAVAKSVAAPGRNNCGACHFEGGGGNAVKHGDMDGTLHHPMPRNDIHMGRHDFRCQDCHRTERHEVAGVLTTTSESADAHVRCTDCHAMDPHHNDRLNTHASAVACQSCHIPKVALDYPTKMAWDWSTAGQDLPEDAHHYLKAKGSFEYIQELIPEYTWHNGRVDRLLPGEPIDPEAVTVINRLEGSIADATARIVPVKVHRGKQPYDKTFKYLIVPKTVGEGGYWTEFDWNQAFELGADATGQPFSGEYGFAETLMYWPLHHMVAPKEHALQCTDCHADRGRLNWKELGYPGDPALYGGRKRADLLADDIEAKP
ncbi:MAG: tetrathionate reductase family octaheme c-type cytochrome [Myxococcota bacterium]|jgi:octaheme c-type cytochrome (tetrathionate reductase family)|nr:tetrathionate reductase family octaheme c-type cytochrome [Myxococcota bacterium]